MFFTLLLVTFLISSAVSFFTVKLFDKPIEAILNRIITEEISGAWHRYIKFAAYVVGISGGVRMYQLERYINAPHKDDEVLVLNAERWTLEVFRTVIETLQSIAWMFLIVFIVALLAYVVTKGIELKFSKNKDSRSTPV